jgi:phospholipid/cholesterol/gamma-HCH transport system substrate-binding protein
MSREAKVGFFVFIGLVLLFLLSTQVGSFKNLSKVGYSLKTYLHTASGLEKNAKVKANGLDIGYVKNLYIDGNKVVAELFIYDGVKIPTDSKVRIEQSSMLGGKFININLGHNKEFLSKNSVIVAQQPLASFDEASDSIKKAADEFQSFMKDLKEVLGKEEKASLKRTILNLEVTLKHFDDMAKGIKETSDKFSHTADIINNRLPAIAKNLDILIRDLKNKAPTLMAKFEAIEDQINVILAENRKGIKSAITNVDGFFADGKKAVQKIDDLLAAVDKVKLEMGMRSEYQSSDGYQKGYVDLDYMPSDTKRYKFSVASMDDYSRFDSSGRYIKPKLHESSKMFISAQIAKRYGNIELRTGLIESTVGAGADYYLLNDNLKLSAEVFDFNAQNDVRGDKAHAKVSSRWTLLKHIDLYAGYDNFLNKESDNAFVGIGFHFLDDDLKKLIMSQSVGSMAK